MSTRAQLLSEIAAQFPDNTTGAITPAKLRQVTEDIANSCAVPAAGTGTITAADITDLASGRGPLLTGTPAQAREAMGIAGDAGNAMVAPYFVDSVGGGDTNSGRTASAPLKTFAALVAKGIVAGDRIYLRRGSYFREVLNLQSKNDLTIAAYGSGDRPTIDGSDNIANASFVQNGTYPTIYQIAWATPTTLGECQFACWENDNALRPFASLALLDASPSGGFFISGGVLYVKATDASNAVSNGRTYSAHGARAYSGSGSWHIATGDNATVTGLSLTKPYSCSGAWFGRDCWIEDCNFTRGTKHNCVTGSGSVQNCYFGQLVNSTWYQGSSNIGFYFNGSGSEDFAVVGCIIENDALTGGGNGLTAHADGGGSYGSCKVAGNVFKNVPTIFGNSVRSTHYEGNSHVDVCIVCDTISPGATFTSIRNQWTASVAQCAPYSIATPSAIAPIVFSSFGDRYFAEYATNSSHFVTAQNGVVSATVRVENLLMQIARKVPVLRTNTATVAVAFSLTGSTVCGGAVTCNGANNSASTYTGDDNVFGSGASNSWFGVSYSGLTAWRAGSGQDIRSTVAIDRVSSAVVSVDIPLLAAGARSESISVSVPGAIKTDIPFVRMIDYGQLSIWPVMNNNFDGLVTLYFRNDSTWAHTAATSSVTVYTHPID